MTERTDIMGVKWQNVILNQTRGMDPMSAYYKEKRRADAERQEQYKTRQARLKNRQSKERGNNNENE